MSIFPDMFSEPCGSDLCTFVFVSGKGIILGTAVIYTHLCTLVFVPGKGITLGTHKLSLSVSWYVGRYTHARAHTRMHTHTRGRKGLNVCSDQISILFEGSGLFLHIFLFGFEKRPETFVPERYGSRPLVSGVDMYIRAYTHM